MSVLADVLRGVDRAKTTVGRNVSDLLSNPADYLRMTAENIPNTVREYGEDPMNFVSGGAGKALGVMRSNSRVMQHADDLLNDSITAKGKRELGAYLKDEGADPRYKDMMPGAANPTRGGVPFEPALVPPPKPDETWYRGGPVHLPTDPPIFTTRDPAGAAWFATERGNKGMGAVNSYKIDAKNPARFRDMLEARLQAPEGIANENYNAFDWLYHPEMRDILKSRGFDSALGRDQLGRDEIETLIALSKNQLSPMDRRIVVPTGHDVLSRPNVKATPLDLEAYYMQLGAAKALRNKP